MKKTEKLLIGIDLICKNCFSEAAHRIIRVKLEIFAVTSLIFCFIISAHNVKAQDANDDAPIKVDTLLLTIPLTVSDGKGRNVPGLKKGNFTIFQNGEEQDIELFLNEEAPMNVAILLDTSYSTKKVLDNIQKAARDFVKILRPEDKAVVVTFDNRTAFLTGLTSDRKMLSNAIEQARITDTNGSDMYEAIFAVINNHFAALKGRKAIIVLTDGMVTGRGISAQQTLDALQKSDILFYPIIFKTDNNSWRISGSKNTSPFEILKILSEETAGRLYEKEAAKLNEAFRSIAEDLKNQYLLGFYPQSSEKGKPLGHVRVAVDRTGFTVRAKKKLSF